MGHAITLGDLLRFLAIVGGALLILGGALTFLAGAFANPETGESDGQTCDRGLKVMAVGAVIIVAMMLVGCAAPAVTKIQTVEVDKPVATQPITPTQVPAPPAPLPPRPADARDALDLALSKWCESVAYIERADPLLRISAGMRPQTLPIYKECAKH